MTSEIVSVLCGGPGLMLPGAPSASLLRWFSNQDNGLSPCECYQRLLNESQSDVIIYVHDDVMIRDEQWLEKVMALFDGNSNCVAVGLGGATALGSRDLYRKPFNIWNMARRGYASNQTDAEVHGERFADARRVAVMDAFFIAVRCDWLRGLGGWPVAHLTHHCLDLWLACEAARTGREIWMTGIDCTHHGGGSSTTPQYAQAKWLKGQSMESDHVLPHRWLFETYRDVLPLEIGQ